MNTINLRKMQDKQNGLIFEVESLGVNIQLKSGSSQRTAWITVRPPETGPVEVALTPGNHADYIVTLEELKDAINDLAKTVENSLRVELESE